MHQALEYRILSQSFNDALFDWQGHKTHRGRAKLVWSFVFKINLLCHRNFFFSKYTLLMSFMSLMLHHPLKFWSISTRRHPQRYAHGIHGRGGSIWEHALRSLRREYARHMKLSLQGERRARDAGKRRRPRCRVRGSERIEWGDWSAFEIWRVKMTSDGWNVTYQHMQLE